MYNRTCRTSLPQKIDLIGGIFVHVSLAMDTLAADLEENAYVALYELKKTLPTLLRHLRKHKNRCFPVILAIKCFAKGKIDLDDITLDRLSQIYLELIILRANWKRKPSDHLEVPVSLAETNFFLSVMKDMILYLLTQRMSIDTDTIVPKMYYEILKNITNKRIRLFVSQTKNRQLLNTLLGLDEKLTLQQKVTWGLFSPQEV
jgi:hypothetical protein